ncbi:MAG: DUF2147 domain-containing protein [Rhodospirillaceae bacterium]|nr:DUF2147 domain-containing protein [Rhodospirillaceae bacterium]
MWVKHIVSAILFVTLLQFGPAFATTVSGTVSGTVTGVWSTEGGKSHVEISNCEEEGKLCGRIIWLKEPLNDQGKPKHDTNNPDISFQARPIVGLPLLANFVPGDEAGVWGDGTIYNPEDGETYSCTMSLLDADTLKVRGYVGLPLFGKSQIWTRVN